MSLSTPRVTAERALPLLAGAAAFALYRLTAFPGVGGRFHPIDPQLHQFYGLVAGPFNSPWHPLYYTLTWLLQWLPVPLSYPEKVTLLSGVLGAASVMLAYRVARAVTGRPLPAFAAALAYACSYSLWIQSTEAEIYTLQLTLAFAVVLLLLAWGRTRSPRLLRAAIFLYFLGFGVTTGMVLLLPALLCYAAATDLRQLWSRGTLLVIAGSALLALLQYVPGYFLGFQAEPLAWGRNRPADLASYLYTVSGDVFHGSFFAYSPRELLLDRVPLLGWYWHREFLLPGVAALLLGFAALFRRARRLFVFLSVGCATVFAFCASYGVDDVEVFLLLSAVFSVPVMAEGVASVERALPERRRPAAVALFCLLWVGGAVALALPSFTIHEQPDRPLRRFIAGLEPGAVLVNTNADWGLTMKLRALLFAEPGLRDRRAAYLEAGPDTGGRRRLLADPDVVVPRALLHNSPVYVLGDFEDAPSRGRPEPVGVTVRQLIDDLRDGDRLVLAWSGAVGEQEEPPPFRRLDAPTRGLLRGIGLSGGSGESSYYLGIGCTGAACRAGETDVPYTPFSLTLRDTLAPEGGRTVPLTVEFSGQERAGAAGIALKLNGDDLLAFVRRPLKIGFPKSRPGPHFANRIVADTQVPTGSVAVLIDGAAGGVRSLAYAHQRSESLPVFDKVAEYCRVEPRDFAAGGSIALGTADARLYLGSGFDLDSLFNGRPVVYSTGPRSSVHLPVSAPRPRYRLRVEARLAADDEQMVMEIAVNGRSVHRSPLAKGVVNAIAVDLPAGLITGGVNRVSFAYSRTRSYFDLTGGIVKETGQRAVRLHELSLEPLPEPAAPP